MVGDGAMGLSTERAVRIHGDNVVAELADSLSQTPMPEFEDDLLPFQQLAHYRVEKVLGSGGFGTVVKAYDSKLMRPVAIKIMAKELATTSPARKRFIREARAGAGLSQENVVQIYAVEEEPLPYLVMEYVPGITLQDHIESVGPLGVGLARALAAAHAKEIIHRDVKPANILLQLGEPMQVKLTDFGLARAKDDASLTQSGLVAGTPMFMSPEQASGINLDHRSDLFSLGSVMYIMVSGRPPYRAENAMAVMRRIVEGPPRSIQGIIPETPVWLIEIIAKLHAMRPEDRYTSAAELVRVLERCLMALEAGQANFSPLPSHQMTPRLTRTRRPLSKRRATLWTMAIGLLAGVVVALLVIGISSQTNPIEPSSTTSEPTHSVMTPLTVPTVPAKPSLEELKKRFLDQMILKNPTWRRSAPPEFRIRDGNELYGISISDGEGISDLSPVRELPDLIVFEMNLGEIKDLTAFRGMKMKKIDVINVSKLASLDGIEGMELMNLGVWGFCGSDISVLKGMPLEVLNLGGGYRRFDLEPLRGNKHLTHLWINCTAVNDISALEDSPNLSELYMNKTSVRDISALKGKKLKVFYCYNTPISNLDIIRAMPLESIKADEKHLTPEFLKSFPNMTQINEVPAPEFLAKLKR
jgi:eukaryotic-like serine/threonine-protein kinase